MPATYKPGQAATTSQYNSLRVADTPTKVIAGYYRLRVCQTRVSRLAYGIARHAAYHSRTAYAYLHTIPVSCLQVLMSGYAAV
eukprot:3790617-Rhodomonas_salina.1